jgi:hypothetical protein
VRVRLRLTNIGVDPWPHALEPRPHTVSVAGHLFDGTGALHERDVLHQPLPRDVAPGDNEEVDVAWTAPLEPGRYRLKLDLVMEHICWFEQRGSAPLDVAFEVLAGVPDSTDPGVLLATLESAAPPPARVAPLAPLTLRLHVRNLGNTRWLATPRPDGGHVAVGAHLLDAGRNVVVVDFARAALPRDVAPGETLDVDLSVRAPAQAGVHVVEVDLVHEGRAWFAAKGSPTLRVLLEVG